MDQKMCLASSLAQSGGARSAVVGMVRGRWSRSGGRETYSLGAAHHVPRRVTGARQTIVYLLRT